MVIIIWILAIGFGIIPALGINDWHQGMLCDFLQINTPVYLQITTMFIMVILVVLLGTYWIIMRTALKTLRKISALQVHGVPGKNRVRRLQMDTKATKNLALVVGAFAICYLPYAVCIFIESLNKNKPIENLVQMRFFTYTLVTLNSGMNPIIYGLRMRSFRQAYKRLLCCKNAVMDENTILVVSSISKE